MAPTKMAFIRKRGWCKRTAHEALQEGAWMRDIVGGLPVPVMWEILQLVEAFDGVQLCAD